MNAKYNYVIWFSKIHHSCYVEAKLPLKDVKWTWSDVMILVFIKECSQNYIKDPLSLPKFLQWITEMFKDDTKMADVVSKKENICCFSALTKCIQQTTCMWKFTVFFHRCWCEYFLQVWSMSVGTSCPTISSKVTLSFWFTEK